MIIHFAIAAHKLIEKIYFNHICSFQGLEQYMAGFKGRYSGVLAFRPTGWTYSNKLTNLSAIRPSTRGSVTIYGIT